MLDFLPTRVLRFLSVAGAATAMAFYAAPVSAQDAHVHVLSTDGCITCGAGSTEASGTAQSDYLEPFRITNRWSTTSAGSTGSRGDAITLTYGIVPDGTTINGTGVSGESSDTSGLVSFLNTNIGTPSIWLPLIDAAYTRWGEIAGLTMVYEANDDGATMGSGGASGVTGTRADMRIGGRSLDGQSGGNVLAYNYFPNNGDHVVDTDNTSFYSNASNDYRAFRNVFMHEAGHGLGFSHLESSNSGQLMEPFISTSFDGPQHDDILAAQRNYGDALEKAGGNDTTGTATALGTLAESTPLSIGTDASDSTTVVARTDDDYISIDGTTDTDVFSFTLDATYELVMLLDPKGPTYQEGAQGGAQSPFNTKALNDLMLELLDNSGDVIATADINGAGVSETIFGLYEAGDYFARISVGSGDVDNVQMYRLDISGIEIIPEPASLMLLVAGTALIAGRRRKNAAA